MRTNLKFLFFALCLAMIGCGSDTSVNVNVNRTTANTNANTNAAPPSANSGVDTVKKPEASTTNNAPTLAPVVHAYYDALRKKDDAAVKQVLASDFIKSLEADMREEKKTNLAAFLAETDQLPDTQMEVRNEKIDGNKGVAEVKGGSYATFVAIAFVNEGGRWKLSNETPTLKP